MTDHTNAGLIAEARIIAGHYEDNDVTDLIEELTAALETAEQLAETRGETIRTYERENADWERRVHIAERKANALAAVVEKVRVARGNHPACEEHPDGDPISCGWKGAVLDIDAALASAPGDALREHDERLLDEYPWAVENRVVKEPITALFRDREDADSFSGEFVDMRVVEHKVARQRREEQD